MDSAHPQIRGVETRQRIVGQGVAVGRPKTANSRRAIALDPDAVAVLHSIKGQQIARKTTWNPDGQVLTGPGGDPIYPDMVRSDFHKVVTGAGLPHLVLRGLRHVHATRLL